MTKKRLEPGFTQLPLWLKVSPELSAMQKTVYAEVVSFVRNNASGWPAISTMALALGLSTKSIERAIAALEEHQLIRVQRTFGKVSHYFVLSHPWQKRDKRWAEAQELVRQEEAAKKAAARAEARRKKEPPSPWANVPPQTSCRGCDDSYPRQVVGGDHRQVVGGTTDNLSVMNRCTSIDEIFEETKGPLASQASPTVNLRPEHDRPHDDDRPHDAPPVPVGSPFTGAAMKIPTNEELAQQARENAKKAQTAPKPGPRLSLVRDHQPKAPPTAPAALPKRDQDLQRVEQAWRAAMAQHQPAVPLAKGDWKATSGPGASAAKLLSEYSAEQVIRYVAWVPEAWAGLQRQHPKLTGAPTMGLVASRWSESWMPIALGAAGAGSSEYDIAVANLTKWMEEHPETHFAPDELTLAVTRAKGKHGKL